MAAYATKPTKAHIIVSLQFIAYLHFFFCTNSWVQRSTRLCSWLLLRLWLCLLLTVCHFFVYFVDFFLCLNNNKQYVCLFVCLWSGLTRNGTVFITMLTTLYSERGFLIRPITYDDVLQELVRDQARSMRIYCVLIACDAFHFSHFICFCSTQIGNSLKAIVLTV